MKQSLLKKIQSASIIVAVFLFQLPVASAAVVSQAPTEILVRWVGSENVTRLKLDPQADAARTLAHLRLRSDVAVAELNVSYRVNAFPNDPQFERQWYLTAIRARDAWSRELVVRESRPLTREVVIAVIDTGVDISHPDLRDNIWTNPGEVPRDGVDNDRNGFVDDVNGWDFIDNTNTPLPKFDPGFNKSALMHGTIVSGIAAAAGHNHEGIVGVAWHAKIMSLRALDSQGNGDALDVYNAIQYAIRNRADIINMSFIGIDNSNILNEAIRRAYDAGIVVVAAAGNSDPNHVGTDFDQDKLYPICADVGSGLNFIVGVASVDRNNQRSRFTNYGSSCIDVAAPGEDFYSTVVFSPGQTQFQEYYGGLYSGTSLSAPLVSGAVALLKTIRPDLGPGQLISAIVEGSKKIENRTTQGLGSGLLDIFGSLTLAETYKPGSATPPSVVPTSGGSLSHLIIAGLGSGSFPQLKVFASDETVFKSFFAYAASLPVAVNVAAGDVDGDGQDEIITGVGVGGGPHVRIFDIEGKVKSQFFAYGQKTRFGVQVATGDVDGDGTQEIITSQGRGGQPEVKIFHSNGALIKSFFAYSQSFLGGVHIAAGDINGDGTDEIITGAGAGGGPHVRMFNQRGDVVGQFFAFNRESKSGVRVAAGDMNNDIFDEIIVAPEAQTSALVRVVRPSDYQTISEFSAFSPDFIRGVHLAVGDYDSDGHNEIIAGAGNGSQARLRIFDWRGSLKKDILAHPDFYRGGVRPAVMRYQK